MQVVRGDGVTRMGTSQGKELTSREVTGVKGSGEVISQEYSSHCFLRLSRSRQEQFLSGEVSRRETKSKGEGRRCGKQGGGKQLSLDAS